MPQKLTLSLVLVINENRNAAALLRTIVNSSLLCLLKKCVKLTVFGKDVQLLDCFPFPGKTRTEFDEAEKSPYLKEKEGLM